MIVQHISKLNKTILDSFGSSSESAIIKKFTGAGIAILKGDFGFAWFKKQGANNFQLAYKSPNLPYSPMKPRRGGINYQVLFSKLPYYATYPKKEVIPQYDISPYMSSYVIVPITYKNKTYGNIVICFKKTKRFFAEDKTLCGALGNAAAQAITINRLASNLRHSNRTPEKRVKDRTAQLQEEKAKDEAVITSIGEGIMFVDKDGTILLINPQAESIVGAGRSGLVGKNLYRALPLYDQNNQVIPKERRPSFRVLQSAHAAPPTKESNYFYRRKNGRLVPVAITVTPVTLQGQVIGAIEVFRDITQERELDRVKSELISLASHQLRTPLSAINWYSEALLKDELGKLGPEQKKYLREIYNANQKMVELVYDYLNVSRMELGTFTLKLAELNIVDISQAILKELRPVINNKKLHIHEQYGNGLSAVFADKKVVRLILQNLITNSVKYTPADGTVEIKIAVNEGPRNNPQLSIIISDNGYGIPKKQQSKIFTKLFRADNTAKLDTEGSGLGLYLAKSFVEFCNGKIWFKSVLNKGTTFYSLIPLESAPVKAI